MPLARLFAAYVQGRVAYFEYSNSWSLLALLVEHGTTASDFYDPIQVDPSTLKFDIPIRPAVQTAQNNQPLGRDHARVFVRLNVLPTDKKEPLAVPVFPRRAPALVLTTTERTSGD